MSTLKKYIVLIFLLQGGCVYSMNRGRIVKPIHVDHIINTHLYHPDDNQASHVVRNDENGVMSKVVCEWNYTKHKTKFPKNITPGNLEAYLMIVYSSGLLLAQRNGLKYIRCQSINIVVAMPTNFNNEIATAYPVLKYISLEDIENADKIGNDSLYIATIHKKNEANGTYKSFPASSKVSDLKNIKIEEKRDTMALRQEFGYKVHIKDISLLYTDAIFGGIENRQGSILLEIRVDD